MKDSDIQGRKTVWHIKSHFVCPLYKIVSQAIKAIV